MRLRSIVLASFITAALVGCGKKDEGKKGPAISDADKTATPTEAQCDAYAAKTIEIGANPANMKDYAKDMCLKSGSVALVKCAEPAKKTQDLGDCLAKYPFKQ
jgi:type IV pilus biogenesis protein CpaD/CtpE